MISHSDQRAYKCTKCNKAFKHKHSLTLHTRLHTGDDLSMCHICEIVFTTTSRMTAHMRQVHTGERPHICFICQKGFSERGKLTKHMRRHSTETPSYQCSVCYKSFKQKSYLTVHMREHTVERPYVRNVLVEVIIWQLT